MRSGKILFSVRLRLKQKIMAHSCDMMFILGNLQEIPDDLFHNRSFHSKETTLQGYFSTLKGFISYKYNAKTPQR